MQTYLTALDQWVRFRKDELDELDAAALSSPRKDELTDDMTLSMALWKAVADRQQLLLAVWDGGRVLVAERERLATLVWGRLDATLDAAVVAKGTTIGTTSGALAVSLPEACRLSDALAGQLRQRLSLDPAADENAARVKELRAALERLRDQVGARARQQPSRGPSTPGTSWPRASRTSPSASSAGATSVGCSGPSRTRPPASSATSSSAAPSGATPATGPPPRPSCATTCWPARPRSASWPSGASRRSTRRPSTPCPTSRRSARCRTRRSSSSAYRQRLARVGDAMNLAHASYAAALAARDDLSARLDALALKASARGLDRDPDLSAAAATAREVLAPTALPGGRRRRAGRRLRGLADLGPLPLHRSEGVHTMKCQQPGCTGTIVDGYCDTCGMAPADGDVPPPDLARRPAVAPAPSAVVRRHQACTQPGCTGTIVDGYCDVCGTPAGASAAASAAVFASALDESAAATGSFRLESAAIGSQRAAGTGATHRTRTGSQRLRSARLGAGLTVIPPVPLVDAGKVVMKNPEVAGGQAHLRPLRRTGRPQPGWPPRAHRRLLPGVRPGVLVHTQAASRRPGRRAVRGGRLPGPRRPRLDLPRPRQERLRPVGGAQGSAQRRRQGRAGGGHRRAALPGPGRAPADRRDLQLRHPRRRRLHRDGVRRRHLAQAGAQGPDARGGRQVRPAARRPGAGLHPGDPPGVPVPPRPRPHLLRLQARQPHPGRRRAQARSTSAAYVTSTTRSRRSTGRSATRPPRSPPSDRASPPTSTRSAARSSCCAWSSRATSRPTSARCPTPRPRRSSATTTRSTA